MFLTAFIDNPGLRADLQPHIINKRTQGSTKCGGTRPSSALRLLRPGPSRPHAHSVRACGRPVGQRLPFDARAVCLPPVAAVAPVSAPSGDDACCSATALHGSGLSSGAAMAAATSAGVMRAHFGARYTWPRRCCAGCRTAAADHLLLETMGCAAVGRSFVMSSNSTEAWDAQEWVVTELQHHPCRLFHPYPVDRCHGHVSAHLDAVGPEGPAPWRLPQFGNHWGPIIKS